MENRPLEAGKKSFRLITIAIKGMSGHNLPHKHLRTQPGHENNPITHIRKGCWWLLSCDLFFFLNCT